MKPKRVSTFRVVLSLEAGKDLKAIEKKNKIRIIKSLVYLELDPYLGKKLSGKYEGLYSLRVWPYRIIYKVYKTVLKVLVIRIGHRQGVYK